MKKFLIFLCLCALKSYVYAYDFKAAMADGNELAYTILTDTSVAVTNEGRSNNNYRYLTCDTIFIPDYVTHEGTTYKVTTITRQAFARTPACVKVLVIPHTVDSIEIDRDNNHSFDIFHPFMLDTLDTYIVDARNQTFASQDGLLYSKDMTELWSCPPFLDKTSIVLPPTVKTIHRCAFSYLQNVQYIELPLSLKQVGQATFMEADRLKCLVFKDSVETIGGYAIDCLNIDSVVVGTGIRQLAVDFLAAVNPITLTCRATTPPLWIQTDGNFFDHFNRESIVLVPRKSIHLYQQTEGWQNLRLYPIEPPIVTGTNTAEVSWVQNFSATGYVWSLYTDAEHMQLYMSLEFDEHGNFVGLILGNGTNTPRRTAPQTSAEEEQERAYTAYYSFHISNLSTNTAYYYTRQALAGSEVLDEESGSFQTLPAQTTALPDTEADSQPSKIMHNGQVYILHNGKQYLLNGTEMK